MRRIDANQLRKLYEVNDYEDRISVSYVSVLQSIDNQLTIKPKCGEWEMISDDDQFEGIYRCSLCGISEFFLDDVFYNYCPHCGADMRGEK